MRFPLFSSAFLAMCLTLSLPGISKEGVHQSKRVRSTTQVLDLKSEKLAQLSKKYKGTEEQRKELLAEFQAYLREKLPQPEKKILLKFGAAWCGPCREIHPEIERFASRRAAEYAVINIDLDSYLGLARALDFNESVPVIYDLLRGSETNLRSSEERIGPITSAPVIKKYLDSK